MGSLDFDGFPGLRMGTTEVMFVHSWRSSLIGSLLGSSSEYIDNPLISPKEELSWVIDNVRKYESARRVQERIKEEAKKEEKVEKVEPKIIEETKPLEKLKEINKEIPKTEEVATKEPNVKKVKKNKEHKEKKFKGSLAMYCLIGFTAGVLLAAITIVIGSFI